MKLADRQSPTSKIERTGKVLVDQGDAGQGDPGAGRAIGFDAKRFAEVVRGGVGLALVPKLLPDAERNDARTRRTGIDTEATAGAQGPGSLGRKLLVSLPFFLGRFQRPAGGILGRFDFDGFQVGADAAESGRKPRITAFGSHCLGTTISDDCIGESALRSLGFRDERSHLGANIWRSVNEGNRIEFSEGSRSIPGNEEGWLAWRSRAETGR